MENLKPNRRGVLATIGSLLGATSVYGCLHSDGEEEYVEPADSPMGDDNWPMHRYDAGNTAYNPGTHGPKGEPEVEWRFDLEDRSLGNQLTPPVVADGMVFFASPRPDDTLYALNAVNGGTVWSYDDFSPLLALADPLAYHDNAVYAVEGSLWSFDAGEGVDLWSKEIGQEGAHQGPKYADGKIFVHGGNVIYCFDEDGSVLWEAEHNSPRPLAYSEGELVVSSLDGYLAVLDAEDGSEVWSIEFGSARPVARDGTVYVSSGGDLYAYDMHGGTKIWSNESPGHVRVLTDEHAYLVSSQYSENVVVDTETGEEVWRLDELGLGLEVFFGAVAGDVLYLDNGSEVYAIDTRSREVLWEVDPGFYSGIAGQPVVADGRIYLISGSQLYCLTNGVT